MGRQDNVTGQYGEDGFLAHVWLMDEFQKLFFNFLFLEMFRPLTVHVQETLISSPLPAVTPFYTLSSNSLSNSRAQEQDYRKETRELDRE